MTYWLRQRVRGPAGQPLSDTGWRQRTGRKDDGIASFLAKGYRVNLKRSGTWTLISPLPNRMGTKEV
ncbi:MAG: hypothetical protein KDB18_12030, partial [Salinibacterium sp.]|nr:hypothetical protein [Salinibacterium sp.]